MFGLTKVALAAAALVAPIVSAAPLDTRQYGSSPSSSSWWLSQIKHQGEVPFGDKSYKVFYNVMEYGAKGDGVTDDTAAINKAIAGSQRCGKGCDSSTTTPAIIYFPPGTYAVSAPIQQYYFTQLVGDAVHPPTIKSTAGFKGMAVLDSDPYSDNGDSWFTNQNNFYRQIRNFVIDLTATPTGAGIHWQVAQATSLQNIHFKMTPNGGQQGIFMDNGSGGWMTDLTFDGGKIGAFFGNQQFTTRNLTFNGCTTAIVMNWNWLWTLKDITINNCGTGIDMSNGNPANAQQVGSVIFQDSKLTKTPIGIKTSWVPNPTASNGTLAIDNVDFSDCSIAVAGPTGNSILQGGSKVVSWAQGHGKDAASLNGHQLLAAKPKEILGKDGRVFTRSKPQFESAQVSDIVSVKSKGAKGDGVSDDSAAIQAIFDAVKPHQIVFFDHGNYLIKKTIKVPKNIKITGEVWPVIMADGASFNNADKPQPVFQVGQPGDEGNVEITDLVFGTKGAAPGAILVEWNLKGSAPGAAGLWDVHWRVGGYAGSGLQSNTCKKNPKSKNPVNKACMGAFMLLHVTKQASIYMENNWGWVADHELDMSDHSQIDIFNGRGALIEAVNGVWMYGTAFEHSQLYNYQLLNAKNVYMGAIQTETPYYQGNPLATTPFTPDSKYSDPTFADCKTDTCKKAWGLRAVSSSEVYVYGAGLYSFFENYSQDCLATHSCQDNMVELNSSKNIHLVGLTTVGTKNMVVDTTPLVTSKNNQATFGATIAMYSH